MTNFRNVTLKYVENIIVDEYTSEIYFKRGHESPNSYIINDKISNSIDGEKIRIFKNDFVKANEINLSEHARHLFGVMDNDILLLSNNISQKIIEEKD